VVWNDLLDSYSVSHHHRGNLVTQIAKHESGGHKIVDELEEMALYLEEYTPKGSESVIVSSNHHDHVMRWLKETTPLSEPWNARTWIKLWAELIDTIEMTPSGASCANPMQLWLEKRLGRKAKVRYLGRGESFLIAGVDVSLHGDEGINGSRGSLNQYARISSRTSSGHSHSPGIEDGAWQAGSSTGQLEYEGSLTTHAQAHIVHFDNGKRTMVFTIDGRWHS
jgi:hypothetical protein